MSEANNLYDIRITLIQPFFSEELPYKEGLPLEKAIKLVEDLEKIEDFVRTSEISWLYAVEDGKYIRILIERTTSL